MPEVTDEEEIDSPHEADEILTELADTIQREAGDLAVALRQVRDVEPDDDGTIEVDEDFTLPFYEEDRELAFVIGLAAGAVLEAKERAAEDQHRLDGAAEGDRLDNAEPAEQPSTSVEQSQEQSVTITQ